MRVIGTTPWERNKVIEAPRLHRGSSYETDAVSQPSRPIGFAFAETTRRNEGRPVQLAFEWR